MSCLRFHWCHLNHAELSETTDHESALERVDGKPTARDDEPAQAKTMLTFDGLRGPLLYVSAEADLDERAVLELIGNLTRQVELMRSLQGSMLTVSR